MMAIANSAGWILRQGRDGAVVFGARARGPGRFLFATALLLWGAQALCGSDSNLLQRAEQKYQEARKKFQEHTNDPEAAWQFGRACFDWADVARKNDQREAIAQQGIDACRQVVTRDPTSAPGHYYLAMNLGQLARTKSLGALRLVDEMEHEFKRACELDAKFDYAGPDRNLGLLYFEAPGWPASIGNKARARKHLEQAVEAAPGYIENHLCLLEAYLKWGDQKSVQRELKVTETLLPKARKEFAGDDWAPSWADWDPRWEKIKERARPHKN